MGHYLYDLDHYFINPVLGQITNLVDLVLIEETLRYIRLQRDKPRQHILQRDKRLLPEFRVCLVRSYHRNCQKVYRIYRRVKFHVLLQLLELDLAAFVSLQVDVLSDCFLV